MLDLLGYLAFFGSTALTYGLICLGLSVQWGETGLFNVGVAGFVAIGAYTDAILTTPPSHGHLGGFDLPIAIGWLAAMLTAGAVSAAVGALTLRLRADYLAITTFGIAVTVQLVCLNAQGLTGGAFGIGFIPRPFGSLADRPVAFGLAGFATVAALTAVVYAVLQRLAVAPWGRVLRSIRDNEAAAAALGKSPNRFRLQAFALGGALMGLGGAVQASALGFIAPDDYLPALTFQAWTMMVVGGAGRHAGAVLGAVLIWALWTGTGALTGWLVPQDSQARAAALQLVGIGVALAAMLVVRPRGLLGERRPPPPRAERRAPVPPA